MDRNRVLEKIQKALNLANNAGATPGEAAAALRSAQRLMEKYEVSPGELGLFEYGFETVNTSTQCTVNSKAAPPHINAVASLIGDAFGLKVFYRKRIAKTDINWTVEYYGRKDKVVMAGYTHPVLMRAIERAWQKFLSERPHLKKERGARYSFFLGFCHAVSEQVTALVVTDEDEQAIAELMKKEGITVRVLTEKEKEEIKKRKPEVSGRIARAGIAAAEDFRLHRPVA